jgi:spore germination protein YaaH
LRAAAAALTDVAYFGAEVDAYGRLTDVPARRGLPPFAGRVHLVICCNSRSLSHFVMEEGSSARAVLIRDILDAVGPYDGLNVDFENVPARDGEAFLSFLRELRSGLGEKALTIALPARFEQAWDNVYNYRRILPLVERIFVMAYDEHWSGSAPGPVASLDWCRRVAEYALSAVGRERLIMGIPFYGRAWSSPNPARAYTYAGIEELRSRVAGDGRVNSDTPGDIPGFTYEETITVQVYYEDAHSLVRRMALYRDLGVSAIGFWRIGQEDPAFWPTLKGGGESASAFARSPPSPPAPGTPGPLFFVSPSPPPKGGEMEIYKK